MDELTAFDGSLILSSGNDGVLPIDDYIESILDETTREHLLLCPISRIPSSLSTTGTVTVSGTTIEHTKQSTYIKIYFWQHTTWQRPVTRATLPTEKEYYLQFNAYTKGGVNKPVVIDTGDKLIGYSITGSATTGTFKYVAFTVVENITDARTLEMISTLCASKVLVIMNEIDRAKIINDLYLRTLNEAI